MLSLSQIVGIVVDKAPLAVGRIGVEYYAAASVGRAFLIYRVDTLSPFVYSPVLPDTIHQLAIYQEKTIVMYKQKLELEIYVRGRQVAELPGLLYKPLCLVLHNEILAAFDTAGRYIVYNLELMDWIKDPRTLPLERPTDECSLVLHPDTYINKVLTVTSSNSIELHNIDRNKRVAVLRQGSDNISLAPDEPIVEIVNSPEIDVVAIIQPSRISLVNLKKQRVLFVVPCDLVEDSFTRASFSSIHALMFIGTQRGRVQVFDLDKRRLVCELKAHSAAVTSLFWLPDTYLLSSGLDNTIRILGYDANLTVLQFIKHRTGHQGDITMAKFYRENYNNIVHSAETCPFLLTTGLDKTLRYTQIYQRNNAELFSSHDKQYSAEIIDFDACEIRDEHWANVVTAHRGEDFCHLWAFFKNKELTEPLPDRYLGREALEKREMAKAKKENGGVLPREFVDARSIERFKSRYRIALPSSMKFIENEDNLSLIVDGSVDANENYIACRLSSETVTCCVISLCGNYVALVGSRSSVAVYALQSGRLVGFANSMFSSPECQNRAIVKISFSYNGLLLYAINSIGYIVIFDIRGRKVIVEISLRTLLCEENDIIVTAATFDIIRGLMCVVSTSTLYIFDISQDTSVVLSRIHSTDLEILRNCLSFCENGQYLIYGGSLDFCNPETTGSYVLVVVYDILLDKIVASQKFSEFTALSSLSVTCDNTVVAMTFVGVPGVYIYRNTEKCGLGLLLNDNDDNDTATDGGDLSKSICNCLELLMTNQRSLGVLLHKNTTLAKRLYSAAIDKHATRELLEQYGGRLRRASATSAKDRLPFYIGLSSKIKGDITQADGFCLHQILSETSNPSAALSKLVSLNHGTIDQEIQRFEGNTLVDFCKFLSKLATHQMENKTYQDMDVVVAIFCCLLRYHALTISRSKELLETLKATYTAIEDQYNYITSSVDVTKTLIDALL